MGRRLEIAVLGALITIACLAARQATRRHQDPTYRGKSLQAWFYGDRTNFFSKLVRDSAQEALERVGTNAFPFLLSELKAERGAPVVYNRAYRVMPAWIKSHLAYPLYSDDIKMIAFNFQQYPPGGSGRPPPLPGPPGRSADMDAFLRSRTQTALIRLRPYLTEAERATFKNLAAAQADPVAP